MTVVTMVLLALTALVIYALTRALRERNARNAAMKERLDLLQFEHVQALHDNAAHEKREEARLNRERRELLARAAPEGAAKGAEDFFLAADVIRGARRELAAILYEVIMRDDHNGPSEAKFDDLDQQGRRYHLTRVGAIVEALGLLGTRIVEGAAFREGKPLPPLRLVDVIGRREKGDPDPLEDPLDQEIAKEIEEYVRDNA